MIKVVTLLLCFAIVYSHQLFGCTTFSFPTKQGRLFGKVLDWPFDHGLIVINKRNVEKKSLKLKSSDVNHAWLAKYGSITFNQHGREFPLGGMNEAGLVVEIMVGPSEPVPDQDPRPSVNELQWIQHALDRYSRVAELISEADKIRISKVKQNVHYFACDRENTCATFEYLNGRLVIHHSNDLVSAAFSNSSYQESADHLRKYQGFGGTRPIPEDRSSLSRFVIASHFIKTFRFDSDDFVSYATQIMNKVVNSGVWRNIYLSNQKIITIHKKTGSTKHLPLNAFDYDCKKPVKILDIKTPANGDVTQLFKNYDYLTNKQVIDLDVSLPEQVRELAGRYPDTHTTCKESNRAI